MLDESLCSKYMLLERNSNVKVKGSKQYESMVSHPEIVKRFYHSKIFHIVQISFQFHPCLTIYMLNVSGKFLITLLVFLEMVISRHLVCTSTENPSDLYPVLLINFMQSIDANKK